MAARKRKSPKGRGRQQPGLLLTGAAALGGIGMTGASVLGGVIARNPSVAGGVAAFVVIFSFVAANALWYQPGTHPHPFFRTRDPLSPYSIGRPAVEEPHPSEVTTFKIERPGEEGATATNANPPANASAGQPNQLVMDIQQQLIRRGLYNGAADGVIGPRTSAAILFFQETVGMPQSGDATPDVLAALRNDSSGPSPVPVEKPREDVTSAASAEDPVAAAIRSAEKQVTTARPAPRQVTSGELTSVDLVLKIQKGLANMAYANVGVDGVAGEQTRAAIRHFQRHYNLPENGEPTEAVLKKLKDIGAI
jgi:peptidoglycan hydrolase-like protein with peptidoglycan-binding domain